MSLTEQQHRTQADVVAPPREVTAADVLGRAADLLEEFGWCQGAYGSKTYGAFCAMGATMSAARDLGCFADEGRQREMFHEALANLDAATFGNTGRWNDVPGRTAGEVVAKLRQAAKAAA